MPGSIDIDGADGVMTILIRNPDRRNALDDTMLHQLAVGIDRARQDDVRVLVIRGWGSESFCSGFDLKALKEAADGPLGLEARAQRVAAVFGAIGGLETVVVGALNGDTVGLGLELASACDVRVTRDGARFGLPAARLGVKYSLSGARRIGANLTPGGFQHLLHTGELVDASRAQAIGLVSDIYPADEFEVGVSRLVNRLLSVDPGVQRHNKGLVRSLRTPWERVDDMPDPLKRG
jgi:enoyl-CoA hydratase